MRLRTALSVTCALAGATSTLAAPQVEPFSATEAQDRRR